MAKRKKSIKKLKEPLDIYSQKRGRGRPPKILASEVSGRAYNYRLILDQTWDVVSAKLLKAETAEDVLQSFEPTAYKEEFSRIASLMLEVLRAPDFPKRNRQARINFLADSLAARGAVTPRTSRDICARERAKDRARQRHNILRREFYIECSCGYQGPAYKGKCPRRHPETMQFPEIVWGLRSI